MKNDRAGLKKPSAVKSRVIALVVISALAVMGLILLIAKATDHRPELRIAIRSRDNVRLEQLLKKHPGLVNAELPNRGPKDLWSPLHMAASDGTPEAIEILTRRKAKVNARDSNGLTPLHYTVARGRYDSAEMLINKGADMNAKGRDGRTPLDMAKNLRDKRLIEMLRIRGAKE